VVCGFLLSEYVANGLRMKFNFLIIYFKTSTYILHGAESFLKR